MRITGVSAIPVTYPFEREALSMLFVRVDTDAGVVGYGESCDSFGCTFAGVVAVAVEQALAPLVVGEELDAVPRLAERMRLFTRRRLGDQWVGPQARSAIEIALWDAYAKGAGRSVSACFGQVRDRVELYASHPFLEEGDVDWHIAQLAPLLARGVRMVKVRVGPQWRADLETLAELVERLGAGIEMMVDGSEIFTLPSALVVARRLAELGVVWFEEPLPQNERAGIEELAARSPVAIAYGEHLYGREDALEALRRRQLSVLQPDASTCGGIGEAREMAALAPFFGARVVPHTAAGPIALAANLHVAASVPSIRALEYPYPLADGWQLGVGAHFGPDAIEDGCLVVPERPGLGVDLDEATARTHPYRAPGAPRGRQSGRPPRPFRR